MQLMSLYFKLETLLTLTVYIEISLIRIEGDIIIHNLFTR